MIGPTNQTWTKRRIQNMNLHYTSTFSQKEVLRAIPPKPSLRGWRRPPRSFLSAPNRNPSKNAMKTALNNRLPPPGDSTSVLISAPAVPNRARRILVADDDQDSRDLENLVLTRAGYLVDAAADGEEAWQALISTHYDLLVTDHKMPRLSGLDLVARIRAWGITLPVIVNSAWPGLDEAAEHSHLCLAAILHKPSDFNEIETAVRRVFRTSYESSSPRP